MLVTVSGLLSTTRLMSVSSNNRNFLASIANPPLYLSFSEVGEARSARESGPRNRSDLVGKSLSQIDFYDKLGEAALIWRKRMLPSNVKGFGLIRWRQLAGMLKSLELTSVRQGTKGSALLIWRNDRSEKKANLYYDLGALLVIETGERPTFTRRASHSDG